MPKISELTEATTVGATDTLPIVQSGVTKKASVQVLTGYARTAAEIAVGVTPTDYSYEPGNVKRYGAAGNNTTDDTVAIQNAINVCTYRGGRVAVPAGYYRVTGTLNVGAPVLTDYDFIVSRTAELGDPAYAANTNETNDEANNALFNIDIEFEPGAFLVADWAPVTPTPVLAYHLQGAYSGGHGSMTGVAVISSAMVVAGLYDVDAITGVATNNLIGVMMRSGCRKCTKAFVSGLEYGLLAPRAFWTRISDLYVYRAGGTCLDLPTANAVTVENIVMWYSTRGVAFDGAASSLSGLHTQQVALDLRVFFSECCDFGPSYFEDVETDDGTGTYAVHLGGAGGGLKILHTTFVGLRVGSARPNKGAFLINDASAAQFINCRSLGNTVTAHADSTGAILGGDFDIETIKWSKLDSGRFGLIHYPGTSAAVQSVWHKNGFSIGGPYTVAAGAIEWIFLAAPGVVLDGNSTVTVTPTSGIDPVFIYQSRISANDVVLVLFFNPTAAPVDLSGSVAITVIRGA